VSGSGSRWRYLARRFLIGVVLVWLLTVITFGVYYAIPSEPANFLIRSQHPTDQQIAHARHALGVDRPIHVQYADYVWHLVQGDLGVSYQGAFIVGDHVEGPPVGRMVIRAAAVTGWLALGGIVLLLLLAVPLAIFAASRAGTYLDRTAIAVSLVAVSTHPVVVALVLQLFVGNRWHIAPANGYCNLLPPHAPPQSPPAVGPALEGPTCTGVGDWAAHLALPWIAFAFFFVALYMRMIRTQLVDVLGTEYVRSARAKGASEGRVMLRHALPNTLLPIITMIGMDIGMAIGVAVYVETVYGLPGLGQLTLGALRGTQGFDRPMILGIVIVVASAIILINLLVDLVHALVDPRVAVSGRRQGAARTAGVV
jgi:peptide/nickel transport system permease protein